MPKFKSIYINGRFLCQNKTGVQKYALGLVKALTEKYPEIIIVAPKGNYDSHGLKIKKAGFGRGVLWEQIWLPFYLMFIRKALLINFCNTAPLLKKNQIITVHDLAFLKNEKWFTKKFRLWYKFLIPRLCRRSLKIITVSQFIKNEIINELSISKDKIEIISNSIPEIDISKKDRLPFRYLFLTGIYNKRKNAEFIISLLPELKERKLHIVGVGSDDDIYENIQFKHGDNFHVQKYIADEEYYALIKNAEALVFPSKYEGFGIPLLEAFVIGTPVIANDIPVLRESYGDMPIYFNLGEKKSFFDALDRLKIHKPSINDLSNLKNKFNFDKSSGLLVELINRIQN